MTSPRRILLAAVLAAAVGTAAAGCGAGESAMDRPLDKVTYLTAFGAVGRDAFAWVAEEKGYFREAGFDVTIQLGAGTDANLKALTAGRADFGSLDLTGVMIQAGKGAYTGVRGIAAVHQQTLVSIIALEGAGISRFDLTPTA